MLEFYFSYRGVLKRLRSGALGAEMDRIAGDLHSQGYKPASAKLYLSRIARSAISLLSAAAQSRSARPSSIGTCARLAPALRGSRQ